MSRHPLCNRLRSASTRTSPLAGRMGVALLWASASLTCTVPLAAQTAMIGGSLVNRESRTPVEGARVSVIGTSLGASSDAAGRFERGFDERRRRGTGFFVTREQILQRNAPTVAELLRTVPSVMSICNLRGCQMRLPSTKGPCSPEFFLDGYPATFSTGPNFPLSQIRGVEVYRDQFSVPAEFQRPNLTCGVIAIWTVEPGTA